MEDLRISKDAFIYQDPDSSVKARVMNHISHKWKNRKSLISRYKHWMKVTALPVVWLFFIFWWYFLYQSWQSTLDKEITKTKNAINDYVSLDDNEIF